MDLISRPLLDAAQVRVADVRCGAPRSGCGEAEHGRLAQVIVPRRGVFAVHRVGARDPLVVDATRAVLLAAGDEYRVSHPADGGDRCTAFALDAELAEEAFGGGGGLVRLDRAAQLAVGALAGALDGSDALVAQEGVLVALGAVADAASAARPPTAGRSAVARAAAVRALLAAAPARRWRLEEIAREVHASPFHLARQFRAATGESVAGHLLRLRLAGALDRLADGDDDLARVAVDCGFAHHSHLTARFRQAFGATPSAVRGAGARELRRIVTAAPRAPT
jgi:AraC-like DNA-binding protein